MSRRRGCFRALVTRTQRGAVWLVVKVKKDSFQENYTEDADRKQRNKWIEVPMPRKNRETWGTRYFLLQGLRVDDGFHEDRVDVGEWTSEGDAVARENSVESVADGLELQVVAQNALALVTVILCG